MKYVTALKRLVLPSRTDTQPTTDNTETNSQNTDDNTNSTHTTRIGIALPQCKGCSETILEHEESTKIPPYGHFHADSDCTPSLEL